MNDIDLYRNGGDSFGQPMIDHLHRGRRGGTGFCVGIPHLWRATLLNKVIDAILAGSAVPERVFVVDNLGKWQKHPSFRIQAIRPTCNLGVIASLNLLHSLCPDRPLIILNDDMVPGHNTFERMLATPHGFVSSRGGWYSCFLCRRETFDRIGPFDEVFETYGCEDADYEWRLKLAGTPRVDADGEPCNHFEGSGSTVLRGGEQLAKFFCDAWSRNHEYYIRKWGGPHGGGERFTIPFNGECGGRCLYGPEARVPPAGP